MQILGPRVERGAVPSKAWLHMLAPSPPTECKARLQGLSPLKWLVAAPLKKESSSLDLGAAARVGMSRSGAPVDLGPLASVNRKVEQGTAGWGAIP